MTGVAAGLTGRRAVLSDLSPAATHIAENYVTPCDPAAFGAAVERILSSVGLEVASMYATRHEGAPAIVEYLVWSDVRACRSCAAELVLWELRNDGLRRIVCPHCKEDQPKAGMRVVGEMAVEANLSRNGATRAVRPVIDSDLGIDRIPADLPWVPSVRFDRDRPMWRRGHLDLGIEDVSGFYSRRNLAALAILWDAASKESDPRIRSALRFSLTAIANRASRRYQWNAKRPTNVLGGTLYISSLRYEWNVLSLWRRKVAAVRRLFHENPMPAGAVDVIRASATALPLEDESIDYCFTDPPFGAHIVYSDSSLLWEAWLDDLTDREHEAIVVGAGDKSKSVNDYRDLLTQCFTEVRRVLKPNAHATIVFQATDPAVWAAVQAATLTAGLSLLSATTLQKGQPSFKQIKGMTDGERVAGSDIVLTFAKGPSAPRKQAVSPSEAFAAAILEAGPGASMQHLFAVVNARLLESGGDVLSFDDVRGLMHEQARSAESGPVIA